MAKIRHLAIGSPDPERLANFYAEIYGMEIIGRSQDDVWITDGTMDVALIHQDNVADQKPGLNHFGFTLEPAEQAAVYAKMTEAGLTPYDPRAANPAPDRPFVEHAAHDPDGNRFDLSTGKRDMAAEKARRGSKREA